MLACWVHSSTRHATSGQAEKTMVERPNTMDQRETVRVGTGDRALFATEELFRLLRSWWSMGNSMIISDLYSNVQSLTLPSHAGCTDADDLSFDLGNKTHGQDESWRTINIQCTVETLELLCFQNRQQRGI